MEKFNNTINSKKLVIVYFYNNECIKTNNIFKNLKLNLNKYSLLVDYDVESEENKIVINEINLCCFPYFYIYKNGVLIDQILGTLNVEKILKQYLSTY